MMRIVSLMLLFSCGLVQAVPLIVISPTNVNSASGYTISAAGTYLLSDDVLASSVGATAGAIQIAANNVVLDLNNKTIFGSPGAGIQIGTVSNITIKNGKLMSCADSGITGTNASMILIDNVICSNNTQMGINISTCTECVIRNCTTEINTGTGIMLFASNAQVTNCIVQANASGIVVSGENLRVTGGQYNKNSASGVIVLTSTQVVIEQLYANDNAGNAGIALLSGADFFVNGCLAQKNTGTGIAIASAVAFSAISSSKALHNGVDGFSNNSGNTVVLGNIAFDNVSNNYGGTGRYAFIQANNGSQTPPGAVIDPQLDNISIV